MPFQRKVYKGDGSYLQLTDLALATLMIFIISCMVIMLAHLQQIKKSDAYQESSEIHSKHQALKKQLAMMERQDQEQIHKFFSSASLSKSDFEELSQNPKIMEIQNSLLEELVQKAASKNSDLSSQDRLLTELQLLNLQAETEYKSFLQYVTKSNPYLSDSFKQSTWSIYCNKQNDTLTFSFKPDSEWSYSLTDLKHILSSFTQGDGIALNILGIESFSDYDKNRLLECFTQSGWNEAFIIMKLWPNPWG